MLQLGHRSLYLARPRSDRTRYPVHGAQLVEDGSLDAVHGVRLELESALEIELVDGVYQAEHPVLHQVAVLDVAGKPDPDAAGDEFDQR